MLRALLLVLGLVAGLSQTAAAQDRPLIAEGDYVAQSENGSKPVAHWKLSRLTSGEYEVTESFVRNPYVTQIFRFDAQFLPIGYSLAINPLSGHYPQSRPDLHLGSFSCIYKANELACDAEYEGGKSHASIAAKPPYTVAIDEYWFADSTWLFTGVVRWMQHTGARETLVNAYLIKDNATGGIALSPDTPTKLVLVGDEQANVLGKMQTVRRYGTEMRGQTGLAPLFSPDAGIPAFSSKHFAPAPAGWPGLQTAEATTAAGAPPALFRSKLQAHIVLPLQAYRCLYPLEL